MLRGTSNATTGLRVDLDCSSLCIFPSYAIPVPTVLKLMLSPCTGLDSTVITIQDLLVSAGHLPEDMLPSRCGHYRP